MQIEGGTNDGQYFHLNLHECIEELYDIPKGNIHRNWNTLNKSDLVNTHLMKMEEFKWILADLDVYLDVYKLFNWGKLREAG